MKALRASHLNQDESSLKRFASIWSKEVTHPCVILLEGDLGAGKSAFARAFIQGLFGDDTIVPSPTFTLVQVYENDTHKVAHFDLYRIEDEEELIEIGLNDYLSTHTCLIEWPSKLGSMMPTHFIRVTLSESKEGLRNIQIETA